MNKSEIVYLALGSNMGDRIAHLSAAEENLDGHSSIEIVSKSKIYETEPWPLHEVGDERGHPHKESGQLWYLNQVIQIKTTLDPHALLEFIHSVESEIGRNEKNHWGSREIDIDILLYGSDVIDSEELSIPHRHMTDRQFVLVPLLEIEPNLKDPVSGKKYEFFLKNISDDHKVEPFY